MQGNEDAAQESQAQPANSLFSGKVPIEVALNELRLRLLDLTGRNRLINFKHSPGKSLQFVHVVIDDACKRLTEQNNRVAITPLPEPDRQDWVNKNGRLARPEAKEYATQLGIGTSYSLAYKSASGEPTGTRMSGLDLRTLFYAEDLGKHCRKLEREAKLAVEETGANMLYLVAGFLEFPESPGGEKLYQAPLLCIPVSITRTNEGQFSSFYLNFTGEEIADNLSLREKLKRDFGFNLPEYDPESDTTPEEYLKTVASAVERTPNWRVRPMLTLTLLSFSNMLLVRDLDASKWRQEGLFDSLTEHPLVKQVFEGQPTSGESQYAEEYQIDDHPRGDLPLIYDADSSQHSALIDVLEGRSRVIEGPPGTGKSQTITNLIAAGLHAGKKILFVAEKLAALEVVKSRLTQAGLDPFVLELHSNKTNKKRILDDLESRIKLRIPADCDLPDLLRRQDEKRKELKAYADLMNTKVGNSLDLTLHQVMWRAERHRIQAGSSARAVQDLDYFPAVRATQAQYAEICDRLRYLAAQLKLIGGYNDQHPLWGFFPAELSPEEDLAVQRVLVEYADKFKAFATATRDAAELLGGSNLNMSAQAAENLLTVLENIAPADASEVDFHALPSLFNESDPSGRSSLEILNDVLDRIRHIESLERQVATALNAHGPATPDLVVAAKANLDGLSALGWQSKIRSDLESSHASLSIASTGATAALRRLYEVARESGLPFSGQQTEVAQLQAITSSANEAPLDLFKYRDVGVGQINAVSKLLEAVALRDQLRDTREQLQAIMYLDALPQQSDITEAVHVLREGDAWYRIFQGRWRKAKRLHQSLSKDKGNKPAELRLRELDMVLRLEAMKTEFDANHALKVIAGAFFDGEKTPLNELLTLSQWIDTTRSNLEGVGVSVNVFDPLHVKRSTLEYLRGQASGVQESLQALRALEDISGHEFAKALANATGKLDASSWSIRIETVEAALRTASQASAFMSAHLKPGVHMAEGVRALESSQQLPSLGNELDALPNAKALLAEKFVGRWTNLSPLFAAHTYGTLVKQVNLPASIESVLISEDCVQNHALLKGFTNGIDKGWDATAEFGACMAKFGRFESAIWTDPSGKTSSAFAQQLAQKTDQAASSLGGLLAWTQYVAARIQALGLGLDGFVSGLENGSIEPTKIEHAFGSRFYAAIAKSVFDNMPALKRFSGSRHAAIRQEYADLDKQVIRLRGMDIARSCRSRSNPPAGQHGVRVDDKTEMKLLEHLIPQQRPRVPVRQIIKRSGKAIQELKPCFMMGPQAVAQYLEPGGLHFDIVVMDEASQLRPEQAIGAIARGSQLVVVGDPKQLPPTSFFSRMSAADTDGEDGIGQLATSDAESILDVCIAHFQPVRTLRWHYRSRHESLIAFSNQNFYRGNLVVFPSPFPKSRSLGLSYHYVGDGIYENQMNHVEAKRVVDAAVDHIIHRPDDSLGIVTLNIKQRDLVAELLEDRLRHLPQANDFRERWEAEGMGLFIKNLENVQGDERDCIYISTTFGRPRDANVVRQNFGPISRDGGWRRLNVLFTRARKSVAVFSSMRPDDIVSDSRTPEGTRALRNYLEYARTGVLSMDRETDLPPDSDFEVAVMDVLRGKGYEVVPQLGVAGFRIDIAVKHPAHLSGYLAAIECDGASYHSGVSVRDRDRIRQEILESLGWRGRIWRIWSTDWFRNPLAETDRLLQFLQSLEKQPVTQEYEVEQGDIEQEGASSDAGLAVDAPEQEQESDAQMVFDEDEEDLEIEVGDLVAYAPLDDPDAEILVRLTARQSDPEHGLIAKSTPLGAVLLGATVGETIVLRVPGKAPQPYVIKSVKRASPEAI